MYKLEMKESIFNSAQTCILITHKFKRISDKFKRISRMLFRKVILTFVIFDISSNIIKLKDSKYETDICNECTTENQI